MKKFLLFAFAAVMAVSASAQQKVDKSVVFQHPARATESNLISKIQTPAKMAKAMTSQEIMATRMNKAPMSKVEISTDVFYGTKWIEEQEGKICNSTFITSMEDAGEEMPGYIQLNDFCLGWANVIAKYDDENKKLIIPGGQYCYEHEQYGKFAIAGLNEDYYFSDDATGQFFDVTFTLDEETKIFTPDCEYVIWMEDYSNEMGKLQVWTVSSSILYAPNAVERYVSLENNQWQRTDGLVYVEDWGFSATIKGFMAMSSVALDIDSETNTVTMATRQPVYDISDANIDHETYGDDFHITGVTVEEDGISTNHDADVVNFQFVDKNIITTAEDEYFCITAAPDGDGLSYLLTWVSQYILGLVGEDAQFQGFNPDIWDGITEVQQAKKLGEGKKFNLMGQQINREHKGIMLYNGKKYLRK